MSLTDLAASDILIIDDTPDNLRFLSDLLSKAGYSVRKVLSGSMGLEAAQLQPPDLILLDIQMPGMLGYEVCERLKADERTQHIPVIFLSARDEELDKVIAFEAGGVDYITKPFQVVEVLARIKTHLQLSHLQRQLLLQNDQLRHEIFQRTTVQVDLKTLNQELESRIRDRTAELQASNAELQTLQTELQVMLAQEKGLGELRSQLITTVAHEFRTPLTVITTAIELLKQRNPELPEQDSNYLKLVADNAKRMSQVLQDVLVLADVDSQEQLSQPELLDLTQLCQTFFDSVALPKHPPFKLTFETQGEAPKYIWADQSLLVLVLSHLVNNALHYSPLGGHIQAALHSNDTHATLHLRDEGIGIPTSELPHIFERFYRASNTNSIAGMPGAGLGLAVAKQATLRLGGAIAATSTLGQGSVFSLQLPLCQDGD